MFNTATNGTHTDENHVSALCISRLSALRYLLSVQLCSAAVRYQLPTASVLANSLYEVASVGQLGCAERWPEGTARPLDRVVLLWATCSG